MSDTLAEEINVQADQAVIQVPETQPAPEGPQEPVQAVPPLPIMETAFVVYMNPQGHWMVAQDVHAAAEMQIMRQPTVDDYFNAANTIVKDIHVQETAATAAQMAVQLQQQALQQMAEQARQAQMNEQIQRFTGQGGGLDLSRLKK